METQKVVFMNKQLNLRLAGLLRIPEPFDLSKNYPAVVVTGPMLSVKEQAQSVYAERLTEDGYVTLVFDGSYFGESEGLPRGQELPDVRRGGLPLQPALCGQRTHRRLRHLRLRFIYVRGRGEGTQAEGCHRHRSCHRGYFHLSHDGLL